MRSRLVFALAVLVVAAMGVALFLVERSSTPDARVSVTLSRVRPIAGEDVRITGRAKPASRPVELQRYEQDAWKRVESSRSSDGGRFEFTVTASSTADAYRVAAPEARVGDQEYASGSSRRVQVAAVTPTAGLTVIGAGVGQTREGGRDLMPAEAVFWPARPGAPVTVQQRVDGTWRTVAADAVQGKGGKATFQLAPGADGEAPQFRAVSLPGPDLPAIRSRAVRPSTWRNVWRDEFEGTTLDPDKWQTRVQSPGGRRLCATPDDSRVTVRDGVAELSIKKVGQTAACPYGIFQNAMIGTAGAEPDTGFWAKYGIFAARVKFQSGQGQHGSFWMQGPHVTGAEIDVAEYFGDGRTDGGLSSYVHYNDADGELLSAGGNQPKARGIIGEGKSPADGWHVYSVEWSPDGYVFRVDGVPTLRTSKPHVASAEEIMVLSLLTSDWELPNLKSTRSTMQVDWVRVWQE